MRRRAVLVLLLLMLVLSACTPAATPPSATALPGDTPPSAVASPAVAATSVASPSVASPADVPSSPADVVTIGFASSEYSRSLYEPLIAAFNAQNPGIQVRFVAIDELFGTQPSASPDEAARGILSAADTAVWSFQPGDIANRYLLDLAPLMSADASFDRSDFYPGVLEAFSANGTIGFLPSTLSVPLLSYNKDLWMASGMALPDPNWSWSSLLDAAGRLVRKRGDAVDVYGLLDTSGGGTALVGELSSTNADLLAVPAEQLRLDTPEAQASFQRIATLVAAGAIYLPSPQASDQELPQLIRDQHVVIWPADNRVRYLDPDKPAFTVGKVPFPQLPVPLFRNDASGYVISAGTQHPQESWRWLSFLSRQESVDSGQDLPSAANVPARRSVAEHGSYSSRMDSETTAALQAALARPVTALPRASNYDLVFPLLGAALGSVVRDHKPVAEATRVLQADLQAQAAELQLTPQPSPDTRPIIVGTPAPTLAAGEGATTISFGVADGTADLFRRAAQAFGQQRHEIAVQIKTLGANAGPAALADAANATDCFVADGTPQADEFAALLDIQPLLDADATLHSDDYPPTLLAPFQRDGGLYGLPSAFDARVLAYNQAAFDAAGVAPPRADWKLNDLLAAAQALTSGTGDARRYGFASTAPLVDLFFFLEQSGAALTRGSGATLQPNFTDPLIVQATHSYVDLLRANSPQQRLTGYTSAGEQPNLSDQIDAGRVGMWFDFYSVLAQQSRPGLTQGIAPLPLAGGQLGLSQLNMSGFFISAKSQHADACWSWISYLSGDAALLQGRFPARSTVAASVFAGQTTPAADVYNAYRAALAHPLVASNSSEAAATGPRIDYFWFFRAIDHALQGKDLDRELADAQALTEEFLTCVRGGTAANACTKQVDPTYEGWNAAPASSTPAPTR